MSSSPRRTPRRTQRRTQRRTPGPRVLDLIERVSRLERENKKLKKQQEKTHKWLVDAMNDIDETNKKISTLFKAAKATTTLEMLEDFR